MLPLADLGDLSGLEEGSKNPVAMVDGMYARTLVLLTKTLINILLILLASHRNLLHESSWFKFILK